jgi:hypothetical protein
MRAFIAPTLLLTGTGSAETVVVALDRMIELIAGKLSCARSSPSPAILSLRSAHRTPGSPRYRGRAGNQPAWDDAAAICPIRHEGRQSHQESAQTPATGYSLRHCAKRVAQIAILASF